MLRAAGVGRLSFGAQSFDREQLKTLQSKVDRSPELERLLEEILKSTDEVKKAAGQLGLGGAEAPKGGNP